VLFRSVLMKKLAAMICAVVMLASPFVVNASPAQDLKDFRAFFKNKFPATPMHDFINGVYSVHKASREQWEAFEEFPSYEIYVDKGEALFNNTKFKNGKGFKNCFPNAKRGIKGNYPYFDTKKGKVVTLEGTINKCITSNGSKKWGWKKGKMAHLSAYLSYKTRGQTIKVKTPKGKKAVAAYTRGKAHFYVNLVQLNLCMR